MKELILISQRLDLFGSYKEKRDNLDPRFINLIFSLKKNPLILPNNLGALNILLSKKIKLDGIILSPGGDPKKKDIRYKIENRLLKYSSERNVPLLGICRGAQKINIFFGGKISKVKNHVRKNHEIFGEITRNKKIRVNSYHDFGIKIKDLAQKLKILAIAKDDSVECFKHKEKKIMGIMWHPERYSKINKFDKNTLIKFFK